MLVALAKQVFWPGRVDPHQKPRRRFGCSFLIDPALRAEARSGLFTRSHVLDDYALKRMVSQSSRSSLG